jgi:multidrug efflux pump subunit AcrA (membrane-fusion protein)
MTPHATRPWLNYLLGVACVGAVVAAFLVVGPASGSQATVTRTAVAAQGVVQSTVSGSGNLQAASQLDLGFKTSGTVTNIYVTQGQHVTEGQLLATLNPESAEVTLEQSKASLQSAEAALAKEEETGGETSAGGTSSGSGAAGSSGASADAATVASTPAVTNSGTNATDIADTAPAQTPPGAQPTTPGTSTAPSTSTTSPATTTPAAAPTSTAPATTPTSTTPSKSPSKKPTSTRTSSTSGEHATSASERETHESKETKSSSSSSSSSISSATREANLASARAAVKSDKLTVQSDEEAVQNTKLYAPEDGTIVSLSGQVGETVSGGGTTKASSSSSSSGSGTGATATGGAAAGATTSAGSSSSSKSSSSSSGSSGSSFAILSDLSSMQLVVALSESEIGSVKAGQPATVTVEALSGAKLAAHVSEVALLSTGSSGAVSYDVTFQLDQLEAGLKVGMSATAEVVVKQAEGVNVPTSAISAGSVTVKRAGKEVRRRVVTGLAGNTSTIVLSGLKAGETVVLPAASATSSSTNLLSKLGSRAGGGLGGGGIGGGAGIGGGGGGGAFFRGGG